MKSRITLFLLISLIISGSRAFSQNDSKSIWKDVDVNDIRSRAERMYSPDSYRSLNCDFSSLKKVLSGAQKEGVQKGNSKPLIVELPMPDGSNELFSVFETEVMHPELAARYPFIKTFSARSLSDPTTTARLDYTLWGFHAMIMSVKGWSFIEPYSQNNTSDYISYYKRDSRQRPSFDCDFDDQLSGRLQQQNPSNPLARTSGPTLRTYRLALACTGEYATFHGGTIGGALSAMVTSVNRVDGVYQIEVDVHLVLISNTDQLIYTNAATDPYTNNSGSTMLGENISNVNAVIGSGNYDIGHVFSTGGGGVAYLGCVCGSSKAGGVTGSSSPVGDNFDIDYVAHEMGHQFGGNHTFNSVTGSCSGNRTSSAAYEPGSGTTIMAYAGICGADDIQPHSDAIFCSKSYDEIQTFITTGSGNSCAVQSSTGNNAPTVNAGSNYTIPFLTPFKLTGSATDIDGDPLTYLWEEYDTGPSGAPNSPSGNAPIFRVFTPVTVPYRIFPRIEDLVRNQQTLGEILPSYARSLTFKFTARDNRTNGGGVGNNNTSVTLTVINTGTAFSVTSPNTNVSWAGLTSQTVTWNVSSTNASPISCANVNILLSTDSGYTFPYTLISNTPNDGSEVVNIPNIPGNKNRIKVESVGNVFFDMSDVNFTIVAGSGVLTSITTDPLASNSICAGSVLSVGFSGNGIPDSGNNYYVQLSNSSGSFASGVTVIGSLLNSTASTGTISATIPGGTSAGTLYRIRVVSTSPAVNGSDNGTNITISQVPAAAGTISGSTNVCQGQSGVTYTVPVIANATGYNWTLPSGASITSGANTNSITVSFSGSATSGSVSVSGTNTACGSGNSSPALAVTVNVLPSAAGAISGPASVCPGSSGNVFSVPVIANANSYNWVLPSGASISSGAGTNSITVTFSASAVSGSIIVNGVNSCGSGTSSSMAVTVNPVPVPAVVSAGGPVNLCPGNNVNLSYSPLANVLYQWRKNASDLSGQNGSSYTANSAGGYDVTSVFASQPIQSFSNTTRVSIPDNTCTGASSSITVSGYSSTVSTAAITIQLNISHTYDGDLALMLEAPDGKILGLSNRVGSSANDYINTIFSDAGSAQIPPTGAPYPGTYKPWTSLFNVCVQTTITSFSAIGTAGAINPNGTWKLWVYDRAAIDTGGIENWTLNLPGSLAGACASVSNTIIVNEIPPVSITNLSPASGAQGSSVIISGGDFSASTAVNFNGTPASFTIDNASQITAIVPPGAGSGLVSVSGPCGTVYSPFAFTVGSSDLYLHLSVLVEGFYRGGGQMAALLGPGVCDSIEVSLASAQPPHQILYTDKGTVSLSGQGDFVFTGAGVSEYYYVVVKHRNAMEIWSSDSVSFLTQTVTYDFTNFSGTAYGGNLISVGGGKFAMFSGDINQDGVIDDNDRTVMETDMLLFRQGYYPSDLSGDMLSESADYSILENNIMNLVQVQKP